MKLKMQKIIKFFSSRSLYFLLGLFIALTIPTAYAAWNSTVTVSQPLTMTLWNDVVAKLVELDSLAASLRNGGLFQLAGEQEDWNGVHDSTYCSVYNMPGTWGTEKAPGTVAFADKTTSINGSVVAITDGLVQYAYKSGDESCVPDSTYTCVATNDRCNHFHKLVWRRR